MPLIECTIKKIRTVTLGDSAYQFKPDDNGRFVSVVEDEEHADRLLEIRCYREIFAAPIVPIEPAPPVAPTAPVEPAAATTLDKAEGAAAQGDPAPAGQAGAAPANITGLGIGNAIQPPDDGGAGQEDGEKKPVPLDREALAAEFEKKFGKKPHHSQSAERIKQLLEQEED